MPWLVILWGYLLGSIPTAYVLGRAIRGGDVRHMGDGNVGAANAYRELGARAGILVFIIDATKGAAAVLLAQATGVPLIAVLFTGVAVVAGHNWPIFIGFRGGRGVSTTIGALMVLVTLPVLIASVLALAALVARRNSTLASAFFFVPLSPLGWWLGEPTPLIIGSIGLPCLVGFTHFLRVRRRVLPETQDSHP